MYFPQKYDHATCLELGSLIIEAYEQFERYEAKGEWRLSGGYTLLSELSYSSRQTDGAAGSRDDGFAKRLFAARKDEAPVPIGFIAERKNSAFIIFRGTQTSTEWIKNMNVRMERDGELGLGNIHDGFLRLYKDIKVGLLSQVSRIGAKKRVYVAGHSLGGSLACLAAADMAKAGTRPIAAVYTFGSPRIGDRAFVSEYNALFPDNSFRVANSSDVVTEIPFSVPLLGFFGGHFTHVDAPVVFTNQLEDIEKNHAIHGYVEYLRTIRAEGSFLARVKRRLFRLDARA